MANNFFTVTEKINGIDYTAQFNGLGPYVEAMDNSYIEDGIVLSTVKLSEYLFTHSIVEPKITIDDFGADKIGTKQEKIINGKKYVAEFKGIRFALNVQDKSYINGSTNTSMNKLSKEILQNIIIEPANLTINDFDTMEEFNEVVNFGRDVMAGGDTLKEFNDVFEFARKVAQGDEYFRQKAYEQSTNEKGKK